jgi:hypothetical protein
MKGWEEHNSVRPKEWLQVRLELNIIAQSLNVDKTVELESIQRRISKLDQAVSALEGSEPLTVTLAGLTEVAPGLLAINKGIQETQTNSEAILKAAEEGQAKLGMLKQAAQQLHQETNQWLSEEISCQKKDHKALFEELKDAQATLQQIERKLAVGCQEADVKIATEALKVATEHATHLEGFKDYLVATLESKVGALQKLLEACVNDVADAENMATEAQTRAASNTPKADSSQKSQIDDMIIRELEKAKGPFETQIRDALQRKDEEIQKLQKELAQALPQIESRGADATEEQSPQAVLEKFEEEYDRTWHELLQATQTLDSEAGALEVLTVRKLLELQQLAREAAKIADYTKLREELTQSGSALKLRIDAQEQDLNSKTAHLHQTLTAEEKGAGGKDEAGQASQAQEVQLDVERYESILSNTEPGELMKLGRIRERLDALTALWDTYTHALTR